jgi:hypothetical protein
MIGVIPGFTCNVSIPNKFPNSNTNKTTTLSENMQFQTITGSWDIFEVEHYISPRQGIFRQKLILYRTRMN